MLNRTMALLISVGVACLCVEIACGPVTPASPPHDAVGTSSKPHAPETRLGSIIPLDLSFKNIAASRSGQLAAITPDARIQTFDRQYVAQSQFAGPMEAGGPRAYGDLWWVGDSVVAVCEHWFDAAEFDRFETAGEVTSQWGVRFLDSVSGRTLSSVALGETFSKLGRHGAELAGFKSADEWIVITHDGMPSFRLYDPAADELGAVQLSAEMPGERLQYWPVRGTWVASLLGIPESEAPAQLGYGGATVSVRMHDTATGADVRVDGVIEPHPAAGMLVTADGHFVISMGVRHGTWTVQITDTTARRTWSPIGESWCPLTLCERDDRLIVAALDPQVDGSANVVLSEVSLSELLRSE